MPVNRKGMPRPEREAEIVHEARRLFLDRGYHATTVSDVAKALDLTSNAVSWYFPTKDDLLAAVLRRASLEVITTFGKDGAELGPDALARALEAFRPYRRAYAVVHERMHFSAAVHEWHDQSREALEALAAPLLATTCPDPARQLHLLPVLVDLLEINLLHHQEDDGPISDLLDELVKVLAAQTALPFHPSGLPDHTGGS